MKLSKDLVAASATIMVLRILTTGQDYGYSILRRIAAASGEEIEWSEGLLYPLLHRLERTELITATWGRADNGRRRKYYAITDAGRRALREAQELIARRPRLRVDGEGYRVVDRDRRGRGGVREENVTRVGS